MFLLTSSKTYSGILLFVTITGTKTFDTPCDIHFTAAFLMFLLDFQLYDNLNPLTEIFNNSRTAGNFLMKLCQFYQNYITKWKKPVL